MFHKKRKRLFKKLKKIKRLFFKKQGQTGFPWIDAIMTQLREEGWIHHLARHAVACFLTRGDLWISWEEGMKVKCRFLLLAFINILEKVNELFEILHYLLRNYFYLFIWSCFLFAFVAFICKNIYIYISSWIFSKVFDELLLDADWSVNAGMWMWLSCSSFFQQFFHCYCPVRFGRKADPNGDYIR